MRIPFISQRKGTYILKMCDYMNTTKFLNPHFQTKTHNILVTNHNESSSILKLTFFSISCNLLNISMITIKSPLIQRCGGTGPMKLSNPICIQQ